MDKSSDCRIAEVGSRGKGVECIAMAGRVYQGMPSRIAEGTTQPVVDGDATET
jgi:hypothetical protein